MLSNCKFRKREVVICFALMSQISALIYGIGEKEKYLLLPVFEGKLCP